MSHSSNVRILVKVILHWKPRDVLKLIKTYVFVRSISTEKNLLSNEQLLVTLHVAVH